MTTKNIVFLQQNLKEDDLGGRSLANLWKSEVNSKALISY